MKELEEKNSGFYALGAARKRGCKYSGKLS